MEKELDNLLSKPASYYKSLIVKNNPKFDFKKPVILFGAAKLAPYFIKFFLEKKTKILALADNDKKKIQKKLNGFDILSINNIENKFGKNIQIVATSIFYEEIINELRKKGFKKLFSPMIFFTLYNNNFDILTWKNNINLIFKNKKNILKVYSSLNDKISKKIFLNILKFRLAFNKNIISSIFENKNEYFDKKIIKLKYNEVFLDGGAYDGDTIKSFLIKSKNIFKNIYAFEPDATNYIFLQKYLNKFKDKRIKSFKIGLGKRNEKLFFTNEGNLQSKIISKGKILIKIIPIDDIRNVDFTYIKLDIEGFEKEALLGGKRTINKLKPKLAICSYHNIEDLWEVPLLIKKINNEYKLYLRHYSNFLFDTICYAI